MNIYQREKPILEDFRTAAPRASISRNSFVSFRVARKRRRNEYQRVFSSKDTVNYFIFLLPILNKDEMIHCVTPCPCWKTSKKVRRRVVDCRIWPMDTAVNRRAAICTPANVHDRPRTVCVIQRYENSIKEMRLFATHDTRTISCVMSLRSHERAGSPSRWGRTGLHEKVGYALEILDTTTRK